MDEVKELAYDLRQKYAQIVGDHLESISEARRQRDYPEYFRGLENLFTVIKHKFKTKKTTEEEEGAYDFTETEGRKKPKEKKSDLQRYKELRQKAIDVCNKYEQAFLGQTEDPNEVAQLEGALREMEMFLFYVMEKAKMFGSVGYNEGL